MPYATSCGTANEPNDRCDATLGSVRLPMLPESVAVARRYVVDMTRVWGVPDDIVDLAELLTSEVVTNAVVHAAAKPGSTVRVSLIRDEDRLIVECGDPSREIPRMLAGLDPLRENGRGLWLVTTLAHDQGVHLTGEVGKSVWFELVAWPSGIIA